MLVNSINFYHNIILLRYSMHDIRVSLNVHSSEDLEFAESMEPLAEWIVNNLREQ